jgi:hypothetical protein
LKPSGRVVRTQESSFVTKGIRDCDQAVQVSRCGICRSKGELGSYRFEAFGRDQLQTPIVLYM